LEDLLCDDHGFVELSGEAQLIDLPGETVFLLGLILLLRGDWFTCLREAAVNSDRLEKGEAHEYQKSVLKRCPIHRMRPLPICLIDWSIRCEKALHAAVALH